MATLERINLSNREVSDLKKIQDHYTAERGTLDDKLKQSLTEFWKEVRSEHDLGECPFHVLGTDIWVLKDANNGELEAFIKMTTYK